MVFCQNKKRVKRKGRKSGPNKVRKFSVVCARKNVILLLKIIDISEHQEFTFCEKSLPSSPKTSYDRNGCTIVKTDMSILIFSFLGWFLFQLWEPLHLASFIPVVDCIRPGFLENGRKSGVTPEHFTTSNSIMKLG